jgi:hypothetical protein
MLKYMLQEKWHYYLVVFSESELDFSLSKEMFVIDNNSVSQIISKVYQKCNSKDSSPL